MLWEGTAGTRVLPQTAGIFGAGRAGQLPVAEKEGGVGHHICKL